MSEADHIIDKFMLITNIKDRILAVNILSISKWDLEEALLHHMDKQDLSDMKETDEQKTKDQVLGEEQVIGQGHDLDREDFNKNLQSEKVQKNEAVVWKRMIGGGEEERGEKVRHRKKMNESSSKEEKSPSSSVGDKTEGMESEENIENKEKGNEKIRRETTFLGILKPVVSLMSPLFRNFGNFISVILNFLSAFLLSIYTGNDFMSNYERKYGTFHVVFFRGSFKEAIAEAKSFSKLLIIYGHEDVDRNPFCEYLFRDPKAKDFIDANFIVYADSKACGKAHTIRMLMRNISLPALLVVRPVSKSSVRTLKFISSDSSASELINILADCIERAHFIDQLKSMERDISREVAQSIIMSLGTNDEQLHSTSNVGLSGMSDSSGSSSVSSYDNSFSNKMADHYFSRNVAANTELRKDEFEVGGETARFNDSRNEHVNRNMGSTETGINVRTNRSAHTSYQTEDVERNVRDRLIREEQDREYQEAVLMDQMKAEKKKEEQRLKKFKLDVKKNIKEERKMKSKNFNLKINEGEQITRICSRFPNGKRIQRDFSVEQTVKNIYEWVECSEFLEKDIITVPYKFELICGHSKTVLENSEKKIKDFDLTPNAVLNVKSLDTSDEE